ncbi:[NiFe]-hydrogenase assembly chaperone HybE [Granulosicoccaceae sp. 1_MG-2023]|nr:[NiFe]-hydrogenase assembly chaperone HybE [Granulosicoccaceae sp. 1_MG-2023]
MNAGLYAPLLYRHFSDIYARHMQDMPVVNKAIEVESRAWREHDGNTLCVMITPWFMSLMLFPPEEERFSAGWKTGDIHRRAFPSGVYEFTAAWDEELGFYQSCSLFSPMFEFDSHALAAEVADHAMDALFDVGEPDEDQQRAREIPTLWGADSADDAAPDNTGEADNEAGVSAAPDDAPPAPASDEADNAAEPRMSRRDLFRAALRRDRT